MSYKGGQLSWTNGHSIVCSKGAFVKQFLQHEKRFTILDGYLALNLSDDDDAKSTV